MRTALGPISSQSVLVQPAKRRRVVAELELDVAVAMQLGFGPHGAGRRDRRQRLQQGLLGGAEQGQRLGARSAVDAVAGLAQDPCLQLFVGVRQTVKVAQRYEIILDVFDAGFHPPFLLWITWRTRCDDKTVAKRTLAVGALHLRLVIAGAGDGALGVVDRNPFGHSIEPFEGAAMTGQPGLHLLIGHDLRVLVPTPGQCHHEDPGLDDGAGDAVSDHRPLAKVDLGGVGDRKVEHDGGRRHRGCGLLQKAIDAVHAAGKAVDAGQRLANAGDLDTLSMPGQDLGPERLDAGDVLRRGARDFEHDGQLRVIRQRACRIQPTLFTGQAPDVRHLGTPDTLGAGNLAVGPSQTQAGNDLPKLVHLEPPVGHRVVSPEKAGRLTHSKKSETGKRYVAGGSIRPRFGWLYYAANLLAPLGRESSGSIRPRMKWLYMAAN